MHYISIALCLIKIVYGDISTTPANFDQPPLNSTIIYPEISDKNENDIQIIKDDMESLEDVGTTPRTLNFSTENIDRKYLKGV